MTPQTVRTPLTLTFRTMEFKKHKTETPFIVNKNLGTALHIPPGHMTQTNADGLPVVELTQKQKYDFDRNGWLLVPGILAAEELAEAREFSIRLRDDPDSIPDHERCGIGGPLQRLADHPVVVGFLNEFLSYPPLASPECYGFRMEISDLIFKSAGSDKAEFRPQSGNGLFRMPGDSHLYRMIPGKAWSGLTRALWELSPVHKGDGTRFISGSHKSTFPAPEKAREPEWSLWDTYECPAGSLILFTEAISYGASDWEDEQNDRIAVSNLYNTITTRWHHWLPDPKLIASMPPKRQALFREVHTEDNVVGGDYNEMTDPFMD